MIRLVHFLKRKDSISIGDFRSYSLDEHGPRIAAAQRTLGIVRHVRTHRDPSIQDHDEAARAMRNGMEMPYDGISEIWWSTRAQAEEALTSPHGKQLRDALIKDEENFIDLENSPLWFAIEYPQVSVLRERPIARTKRPCQTKIADLVVDR